MANGTTKWNGYSSRSCMSVGYKSFVLLLLFFVDASFIVRVYAFESRSRDTFTPHRICRCCNTVQSPKFTRNRIFVRRISPALTDWSRRRNAAIFLEKNENSIPKPQILPKREYAYRFRTHGTKIYIIKKNRIYIFGGVKSLS